MNIESKNPIILVFAGKARSGKDTSASFVNEYAKEHNLKCINLQFSYYIKMYAKMISSWDGEEETKPRSLLQELGTDVIRDKIDNYFFINRIIGDIKVLSYYADIITISDARLPEELDSVKNAYENVYKIKIERPEYDNNLTGKEQVHRTETSLNTYNDYDYIIVNDSSLDNLKEKIYNVLSNI